MMIIIVAVTIMIVIATDIKQMRGIPLMLLLTVSTAHMFNCDSHMTHSPGIIIKNLDGHSTEQSVSTIFLLPCFIIVDIRLKQLCIMFIQLLQLVLK